MTGRCVLGCACLVAALAFLLLFASGSSVKAVTYKIQYTGALSCAGTDGIYGTGDDSCVNDTTYGPYGADLNADVLSHFEIPEVDPKHSQFSYLATMGIPANWWVATDKEIPNGAFIGTLDAVSTLALFGGFCTTTLDVHFPMYDCTTDNFEGVNDGCPTNGTPESNHECNDNQDNDGDGDVNDGCPAVGDPEDDGAGECDNHIDDDGDGDPIVAWDEETSGENLTYGHECGLPAGCRKYPQHVNTIVEGVRPRARYYGFTVVIEGMPPTQVEFLIFNPEELTEMGVLPETDMGDALGYINYVILDNPPVPAAADSSLDELCTPLSTDTNLHGITDGEGHLIQAVPPVPTDVGSFWLVTDPCGNGIDDDADTRIDEMCGIKRVRNPEEGTGILGTGSHLLGAYSESYRDADKDSIGNNADECPFDPDVGLPSAFDHIDASCGDVGDCIDHPSPEEDGWTAEDADGDGWRNQADNCPCVWQDSQANDADDDNIGDECDPNPDTPDGPYVNDLAIGSTCIEADDTDGDGWCDDTEDIVGHGGEILSVKSTTPEYNPAATPPEIEVDLNPVDDVKDCVDGIDNDGDGYIDGAFAPAGCAGLGCDAGCSTPEWRVLDPLIKAADNPPGQAPGTCSNRTYYHVDRLGGAEVDDDGDTVVNWLDPNCVGMDLDLQTPDLQPPGADPLVLPKAQVPTSTWHEMWPNWSNNYIAAGHIDHDGDTVLSQGDQIELDDGHWYHVDEVTVTIKLEKKPTPSGDIRYLEWYASAEDMQDAIHDPLSTQWREAYPTWNKEYELIDWTDNTDGVLSASDQIVLEEKPLPGVTAEFHVDRVSIDIIVTQKPDDDIDQDGVLDGDDNCPDQWNPTQVDRDHDGIGDECDPDDDADKINDNLEWRAGTDPKNVCDPRDFDLTNDNIIDILDVLTFKDPLAYPNRACFPPDDYTICEATYRSNQ